MTNKRPKGQAARSGVTRDLTAGKRSVEDPVGGVWATLMGIVLAVALVKLGNPVVLTHLVKPPQSLMEWVFLPWPTACGYGLLGLALIAAWPLWRRVSATPRWLLWLPLAWLAWQGVSVLTSLDRSMSLRVFTHYATVAACFLAGWLVLGRLSERRLRGFWLVLLAGFGWVVLTGFDQHYGGLEATRRFVYAQPDWQNLPPDLLKRIAGDRVFSTLFYANTLAGVVLLLLPVLAWVSWHLWPARLRLYRAVSTGLLLYMGLACLVWSGSKAGWLIAALLGGVAVLHAPLSRRTKVAVVVVGFLVAMTAFGLRFQDYFRRGATSAVARFDYWTVAASIAGERPLVGAGPGAFHVVYQERKPPEAEMARLVHNDYLQQASDSGVPGGLLFGAWVVGALIRAYGLARTRGGLRGPVWLGLLGWALQALVEFGLFIPAVAWVAMVLLGWSSAGQYSDGQGPAASLASENQ